MGNLINIDPHSAAWLAVQEHCESRMAALRAKLELELEPMATTQVRAQLREIKLVLKLVKSAPVPRAEQESILL